jgi:hypothetical protein
MPKGTRVHNLYDELRRGGKSKASAARIAQAETGLSLQTGKPPKHKSQKGRK